MSERPGVVVYFELLDALPALRDAEKGQLFEAILRYGRDGETPDFSGALFAIWALVKQKLDRDTQRYVDRCEKARAAVNKRWGNTDEYERIRSLPTKTKTKTKTKTETETKTGTREKETGRPPSRMHFPSLEEVERECKAKGYATSPTRFFNYYEATGWKGIVNWRAKLAEWGERDAKTAPDDLRHTPTDAGELERMKKLRESLRKRYQE